MERPRDVCPRVLGGLDATRDGAAFDLGGRRRRAVLAAVVIARGQAVTAGHLAGCVWGEDAPAHSPPGALQSYVSHLRRRLQPDVGARSRHGVIASTGAGYALRLGPDAVDAWRFEHAVASTSGLPPARSVQDVGAIRSVAHRQVIWDEHDPALPYHPVGELAREVAAVDEVTRLHESPASPPATRW